MGTTQGAMDLQEPTRSPQVVQTSLEMRHHRLFQSLGTKSLQRGQGDATTAEPPRLSIQPAGHWHHGAQLLAVRGPVPWWGPGAASGQAGWAGGCRRLGHTTTHRDTATSMAASTSHGREAAGDPQLPITSPPSLPRPHQWGSDWWKGAKPPQRPPPYAVSSAFP